MQQSSHQEYGLGGRSLGHKAKLGWTNLMEGSFVQFGLDHTSVKFVDSIKKRNGSIIRGKSKVAFFEEHHNNGHAPS